MSNISHLIEMLQSQDHNKRYEACEELRVSQIPLPQEALDALAIAKDDKDSDVADAARRAIALHTSSIPQHEEQQEVMQQAPLLLFWENRKRKLWSIFFMIGGVFVLTLPWSLFSVFLFPILYFPAGLIGLVGDYDKYSNFIFPLWVIYLGLATVMVLNNKRKVVISTLIILSLLLMLNVVGCQMIAPSITEGIS